MGERERDARKRRQQTELWKGPELRWVFEIRLCRQTTYQESSQLNSCLLQKEGVTQNANISPQGLWAGPLYASFQGNPVLFCCRKKRAGLKVREKNKRCSVLGGFAS